MTALATRIAHDHQPTATGCSCGKRLIAPKCARGSLMPFVEHVAEVTQEKVAAEIEWGVVWNIGGHPYSEFDRGLARAARIAWPAT